MTIAGFALEIRVFQRDVTLEAMRLEAGFTLDAMNQVLADAEVPEPFGRIRHCAGRGQRLLSRARAAAVSARPLKVLSRGQNRSARTTKRWGAGPTK